MKKSDTIIGIFLIAFSTFYYLSTKGLPPPTKTENLGAAFFPTLLAMILVILSLLLIFNSLFSRRISREDKEKAAIAGGERLEEDSFSAETTSNKFLLGTMGISALYIILLPIIGYVIVTPLFLIAMIRLLGKKKWIPNIAISILLTISLYLLFAKMLGVVLPGGMFLN